MMARWCFEILVLSGLLPALWLPAVMAQVPAERPLRGDLSFFVDDDAVPWVGQEVELNLELWSDGLAFGGQSFVLPEVQGGLLLQADSTTVKLNEMRDGVAWQGLRYTLLLYPQRAGRIEVPSFDVRFSARAGYGSEPRPFTFRSEPLYVEARLPPGLTAGSLVVTTTEFSLQTSWSRSWPDEGPLQLQTGDAVTLEVVRRARDVPGMVFPPLPAPIIEGLGVYPNRPVLNDRVNRGELSGERRESLTFVCERPGRYQLPAVRFAWWDPDREVLAEKLIPALELEVAANPAYRSAAGTASPETDRVAYASIVIAGLVAIGLLVLGWWRYGDRLRALWSTRKPVQVGRSTGRLVELNPRGENMGSE